LLIIFTTTEAVIIQAEMLGKDYFYMVQDRTDCLISFDISCIVLRLAQQSTVCHQNSPNLLVKKSFWRADWRLLTQELFKKPCYICTKSVRFVLFWLTKSDQC